jgi:hypothetical protein
MPQRTIADDNDRIDADAIEAVLAEQARRCLHDPLAVFRLTI